MLNLILVLMTFTAPGDLYRCVDRNGQLTFGDRPCAQGAESRMDGALAGSPDADGLRDWLEQMQRQQPAARPTQRPVRSTLPGGVVPSSIELPARPLTSGTFNACSGRFFACTNGSASQMDACVAAIPSCTANRRSGCCDAVYTTRYQRLREAGAIRHVAVREALLGR